MAQKVSSPIEVYEGAVQQMLPTLAGVRSDQLGSSTPCTEWNVQQLIQHNIRVSQFVHSILTGAGGVDLMDLSGELPPEGAAAAFESSAAALLQVAKSRDMEEVVETPFGPMPLGHFLGIPTGDVVIHKWDLAKATNQDTTMDGSLAEVCYNALVPAVEGGRKAGFFGAEVILPISASIQQKLLGLSGRQP